MALLHRLRRLDETSLPAHPDDAAVTFRDLPSAALTGYRPGPGGPRLDGPAASALPPSVARVAARTRLSAELLAAILEVDARGRATLDDIERADALAERLLARRADRQRAAANAAAHARLASSMRLAG